MSSTQFSRRDMLRYSLAGAAAGGVALLGACSTTEVGTGAPSGAASLSQRVQQGKPVRLAIANEPPFTELQPNGEVTGAAPDVAKAVLNRMGITKVQGKVTDYSTMIAGLTAKRWDIVTAGLFMDRRRCAAVMYASPVLVSTESFATAPGNPLDLTSVAAAVSNPDVTIGTLAGSYEFDQAVKLGMPEGRIKTYPRAPAALTALGDGRVDAVLLPTGTLNESKKQPGANFAVTPKLDKIPPTGSSAAFSPSDADFFNRYNGELEKFKRTRQFATILDRWGFSAQEARQATTEQLCAKEG